MGGLLQVVGLGWAAIGVWYVVTLVQNDASDLGVGMGVILAMVICILPGLGLAGIGSNVNKKSKD